jgi:hypothetical protein
MNDAGTRVEIATDRSNRKLLIQPPILFVTARAPWQLMSMVGATSKVGLSGL